MVTDTQQRLSFRELILLGLWFGLLAGLVEGAGLLWLRRMRAPEILWVAPAFDVVLFGAVALALFLLEKLWAAAGQFTIAWGTFCFMLAMDWIGTPNLALRWGVWRPVLVFLAFSVAVCLTRWTQPRNLAVLKFSRNALPWAAATAMLVFLAVHGGMYLREGRAERHLPGPTPGAPNVVLIVVDTLRADHLSAYGYTRRTSPHVDAISGKGVLFENAIAPAPWTLPSHASMFTGLYPHEHHTETPGSRLDDRFPTLAEALASYGYFTGGFSANVFWVDRGVGLNHGFSHFEDRFTTIGDCVQRTWFGMKMASLLDYIGVLKDLPGRRNAAAINRSALAWIDAHRSRPFFIFLNYLDVHDPYLPPYPYRTRFSRFPSPGGLLNTTFREEWPSPTPENIESETDAYDGGIAYVDEQIAQLLAQLERRGLAENTLVVITSDHGESFGEHGLWHHASTLYRNEIHVPLVLYWPGHIPAAKRIADPVSLTSMPATLFDVAGLQQSVFPAPSLAPLWRSESHAPWQFPRAELTRVPGMPVARYNGRSISLITPRWQYILHDKLGPMLFDYTADPRESTNLAKTPEGRAIIGKLGAHYDLQFPVANATPGH